MKKPKATVQKDGLHDRFGRQITYLRFSITEHCNFRCQYCSPAEGTPFFDRKDHLNSSETQRLLRIFRGLGLQHLRLTGGEPLIHPRVVETVRYGVGLGIGKVSLSTNGYLLDRFAADLQAAGLNSLNVSLDTLDPERFHVITRGGSLAKVLSGIEKARSVGIPRIKLNAVLMRGKHEEDILQLVDFAQSRELDIRFIEMMPLGVAGSGVYDTSYLSAVEARSILEQKVGRLFPIASGRDQGPARLFRFAKGSSQIGFITPISDSFCASCNRVRLTAAGRLVYCLGQEQGMDLLPLLREPSMDDGMVAESIRAGVWADKPEQHAFLQDRKRSSKIFMMRLGG
ncbi:GTP 3',8-cyclase MoaA [Candidatus Igneacidithiobacillus taiwanensis]|uniref:GTP 3',8-cyclase MoaA n=1 Tax=Candidatus Igneacidithiobacillus taiwanensis TaxID=1945924 RepID=UPI002899FEE8|nr:GTP 3',8-cyclase MoaA [Candidatus Igneacidithiobacillus taiwanensis]